MLIVLQEMTPAQEGRLMNQGCLVVFVCLVLLGTLAYYVDGRLAYVAVGLLLVWLAICRVQSKRETERLESAFDDSFKSFTGSRPELKRSSSYGYPQFSVCFKTKEEMIQAFESGHLKKFRSIVAELYGFGGFDIEKGFDETYVGWEEDFRESMKTDPSSQIWIDETLQRRAHYYDLPKPNEEAEQVGTSNGG